MPKEIVPGVYAITPAWTDGGKRIYLITGWTEGLGRVRLRKDTYEEAKEVVKGLEDKDRLTRAARAQNAKPIEDDNFVFGSKLIATKARLADIEAALQQLPVDKETGLPDPKWSLKDLVAIALRRGIYNPNYPLVTVAEVAPTYTKFYEWRNTLDTKDPNYVAKTTLKAFYPTIRRLVKLFGTLNLQELAAEGELKNRIQNSGLQPSVADKIASTFNGMAFWATEANLDPQGENPAPAHSRYLADYKPWSCPYTNKGIPDVYTGDEYQAILDRAWNETVAPTRHRALSRAATVIVRIWCSLRPSETDNPDFYLNEDCSIAYVPENAKTGFRMVEVPPCAQIQLLVLKALDCLSFKKTSHQVWALFRGKVGFPVNSAAMRAAYSREIGVPFAQVTAVDAEKWFRSKWPLRFPRRKPDTMRHTGGTAHANACQDLRRTAFYMGNSLDVLEHYLGKFPLPMIPHFYQTVATPLKAFIDCEKIPLPPWFNSLHARARQEQQEAVLQLVESLVAKLDAPEGRIIQLSEVVPQCSEPAMADVVAESLALVKRNG